MNKYKPHLYLIPEDDRNRQIAVGFRQHHQVDTRRIQPMPPAGGWTHVLDTFQNEYVQKIRDNANAHVVMLVDFDDQFKKRRADIEEKIPQDIKARVFVVGAKKTPETLKNALNKSYEEIGESLAGDSAADTTELWSHEQLKHNEGDRLRLVQIVKPFLFQALSENSK